MSPRGLHGQALTALYEDLRRWVLAPDTALAQPRGLGVVLQQGLPAWLQVWARWTPSPLRTAGVALQCREDAPPPVPSAGPALVVLLSNMALASRTTEGGM
jgi:hypothetical protein